MPGNNDSASASAVLRARAEEQVRQQADLEAEKAPQDLDRLVHELRVHQIELEMQNEQLRASQCDLETARERYAELYDFAPVGYVTLSQQGLITRANLTSVAMLGIERSRLGGVAFSGFVATDDQEIFYRCWHDVFVDLGELRVCELRMRPWGLPVFHARLQAIEAQEEGVPVCRLTISDITEQKRAEQGLRDSQRRQLLAENDERMRLALEAGGLGAWDQNLATGRIICSERARQMLVFPADMETTWETVLARVHPGDRPTFRNKLGESAASRTENPLEITFRIVLPDESIRWLRFHSRCQLDPSGRRAIRRTGVLADITHQRQTEELLESRAKHLDLLVRERTARLQEAVAELEHFSYTLAHDLRAPLRAIHGYGELLLKECRHLAPEHKEYLERCNLASARMDQLILDALNYNKLVREHFPLEKVDTAALLGELLDSYPQFHEARANISIVGPLPVVTGNPSLLTQCLSNLLNNALKFIPPGKVPAVRVTAQDLGARVRIWVEDNGIGIAEDCQDRIFRMFERLDDRFEGTGVGLPLVKKAAERMHGAVGVESHPGQGSRFWLELKKPEPELIPVQ